MYYKGYIEVEGNLDRSLEFLEFLFLFVWFDV